MTALGLATQALASDAVNRGKATGGVVQLEFGNEDRGLFAPVFEPLFDNTVGEDTSDGHLTWGWRIALTPNATDPEWFRPIQEFLPWLSDRATVRSASSLQQYAFTPDENRFNQGFKERPHAGFLTYEERASLADPLGEHSQRLDTLALTLGVVGPLSGAEALHEAAHDLAGETTADWDQLDNEPVINLYYEHARRFLLLKSRAQENLEFMPYGGVALGNALTYGAIGATVRIGGELTKDRGAYRPGPLLNSNIYAEDGDYWAWSLFLGSEARLVAHNLFVEGNTFQDNNLGADAEVLVYDFQAGFEVGWGANRLTIVNLWRSEEFETQGDPDQLLKATFSYAF